MIGENLAGCNSQDDSFHPFGGQVGLKHNVSICIFSVATRSGSDVAHSVFNLG